MEVIRELLEEAIGRAGAFATQAGAAIDALTALLDRYADLGAALSTAGDAAHARIQDLAGRLEAAEHAIEVSAHEASSRLDAVDGPASGVRDRVAGLMAEIRDEVSALNTLGADALDRADGRLRSADEAFQEVFERLQAVCTAANDGGDRALASIARFRHEVDLAAGELRSDASAVVAAMGALDGTVRSEAGAYMDQVSALVVSQTALLVEMGNRMLTQHNETVVPLRRTLTEEVPAELGAALEPLQGAVTALVKACHQHGTALRERADEILQRVSDVIALTELLKPSLETAERLP